MAKTITPKLVINVTVVKKRRNADPNVVSAPEKMEAPTLRSAN